MHASRRRFIKSTAKCAVAGISTGMFGLSEITAVAAPEYRAAVCINLAGGNDGSNLFVATDESRYRDYANSRGFLALPRADLRPAVARSTGEQYGFHPQLPGLSELYVQRRLAVLANVGTLRRPVSHASVRANPASIPTNLFSHNNQQNQWQSPTTDGVASGEAGWGGMIADALLTSNLGAQYPPVTTVAGLAVFCEGKRTRPASVQPGNTKGLRGFNDKIPASVSRRRAMQQLLDVDLDRHMISATSSESERTFAETSALSRALANLPPLLATFPDNSIGKQLHQVAKIIQARHELGITRQIFYTALSSFDNHANQLPTQAFLLGQLDEAMAAFYRATEELGVASQVVSFTVSEFGRTLKPSNGGSDHAWGNHHLIMGGGVRGGDLYGTFPSTVLGGADDADERGRMIPTTAVDQYAATIAAWLGVSGADIAAMFPNLGNFRPGLLGFI